MAGGNTPLRNMTERGASGPLRRRATERWLHTIARLLPPLKEPQALLGKGEWVVGLVGRRGKDQAVPFGALLAPADFPNVLLPWLTIAGSRRRATASFLHLLMASRYLCPWMSCFRLHFGRSLAHMFPEAERPHVESTLRRCGQHSAFAPLLPASRQPSGFSRSAGQIEYCSSWCDNYIDGGIFLVIPVHRNLFLVPLNSIVGWPFRLVMVSGPPGWHRMSGRFASPLVSIDLARSVSCGT